MYKGSHCNIPGRGWDRDGSSAKISPTGLPISKTYSLAYPDGSKQNMSRQERDNLVLSGLVKEISPLKYAYTGQQHTFHTFSDLSKLQLSHNEPPKRRFLSGSFIWEHAGKRRRELMETPESIGVRVCQMAGLELSAKWLDCSSSLSLHSLGLAMRLTMRDLSICRSCSGFIGLRGEQIEAKT